MKFIINFAPIGLDQVMANVVLIGATGFVGPAVLNELISRGHKVTAVVRNATKLPNFSPAGEFDERGERTGKFRLGKDDLIIDPVTNSSHISVQDYAIAMVDELEKPAHHKERFTIGY